MKEFNFQYHDRVVKLEWLLEEVKNSSAIDIAFLARVRRGKKEVKLPFRIMRDEKDFLFIKNELIKEINKSLTFLKQPHSKLLDYGIRFVDDIPRITETESITDLKELTNLDNKDLLIFTSKIGVIQIFRDDSLDKRLEIFKVFFKEMNNKSLDPLFYHERSYLRNLYRIITDETCKIFVQKFSSFGILENDKFKVYLIDKLTEFLKSDNKEVTDDYSYYGYITNSYFNAKENQVCSNYMLINFGKGFNQYRIYGEKSFLNRMIARIISKHNKRIDERIINCDRALTQLKI